MGEIQKIVDRMDPEEAIAEVTPVLRKLLSVVQEEVRIEFMADLIGEAGEDKVASMVHF
jgi:hypothetical protein